MKVVWLPHAVADLANARAYIAQHNPSAAKSVAARIKKIVSQLCRHPYLGRPTDVEDVREMTVAGLPYLIPYRVRDDRIEILRVFIRRKNGRKRGNRSSN